MDQASTEKPVTQAPDKNIWAEPTLGADGTISYKIPPLPVMKILDNPSPDNVKQYVDWNNERMDRIRKATEALRTATLQPSRFNIGDISGVDFFFSPTCPYCKMQAPIVQQFAEKIGVDKVTGYAMSVGDPRSVSGFINGSGITFKVLSGEDYGRANNVTGWPTILIHGVSGETKRIDGFSQSIEAEWAGTTQSGRLEEILPPARASNQCSSAHK